GAGTHLGRRRPQRGRVGRRPRRRLHRQGGDLRQGGPGRAGRQRRPDHAHLADDRRGHRRAGMTVELEEIVERLGAGGAGGEGVEAYAELTTETSVTAFGGEVEQLTSASSSGCGVGVVKAGRRGYAYTADLSDAGLRECLAEARANLEVSGEDPGNVLPEAAAYEALDGLFDTRQAEVDPERKVSLALDLEARTRAADPKVTQVESARYGDVVGEIAIASSLGVSGSFAVTHAWCVS